MRGTIRLWVLLATAIGLADWARSDVLLYDGFDGYEAGRLDGVACQGFGFAAGSSWTGLELDYTTPTATGANIVEAGLDATQGMVRMGGSPHAAFRALIDSAGSGAYYDSASGTLGGGGVSGSVYLSFLFHNLSTDRRNEWGGIQLGRTDSNAGLLIGNNSAPWAFSMGDESTGSFTDLLNGGGAYLVLDGALHNMVTKITFNANGADSATTWLDPVLANGDAQSSAIYRGTLAGDFSFDRLLLTATRAFEFDEMIIGENWNDLVIVPEAATLSLITLFGAVLLFFRNKWGRA